MAEADKELQKPVVDHLKRLYEQYKSNSKVFTATHIGHLSLSIVFVLSILLPFLYLQIDERETNTELRQLSQRIAKQEQHVAVYRQSMTGLKKVFEAVENTPKPLEGYIQALEKEAGGGPVAALPGGIKPVQESCGSPSNRDAWMDCRIRQYMAARAAQWQAILANEIATPLETLNNKEFDQWKADLQAGMKKLAERARSEMASNPRFWREFNQNAPVYRSMVDGVHQFWADHRFEEIGRRMEEAASVWRADVEKLNNKKEEIQKSKEGLNNALKNIKTRFGKLGLELEDAILLAPVAFSALFMLAAMNLCKNIRLRKSFIPPAATQDQIRRAAHPRACVVRDPAGRFLLLDHARHLSKPDRPGLHEVQLLLPDRRRPFFHRVSAHPKRCQELWPFFSGG